MDYLTSIRPLLCQQFVGREQELQELKAMLKRAATGQAQFCLLSGEAGVGKTRLCHAFLHLCQEQQATVLSGQATPYDQKLPFGPFLDLFRRSLDNLSETSTPFQQAFQTTFSFLLQLSPDLALLFPTMMLPAPPPVNMAAHQLSVIFHQVLRGLQTLSKICQGPLIVVLEDLHCADETSLELLTFLARRLGMNTPPGDTSTPLLILGTYRSEAFSDTPALQRLWSHLSTQRQVEQIRLAPLSRDEHQQCVNHILNQTVPEEFSSFLFAWDEGNPFFIEELLSAMLTSGQLQAQPQGWLFPHEKKIYLPPSLTSAILERFVCLPLQDQEILSYAAVIGRTFHFTLLVALCKLDERELIHVLHRAVNIQLISEVNHLLSPRKEDQQELYQFRHALTHEALYRQMLQPERRMRHRIVAEAIEALVSDAIAACSAPAIHIDNIAQLLVEHYHQAGLDERAQPYALQETQRAGQVGAFREERFYLEIALTSFPEESTERLQLLERLGMVSMGIHDFSAALHWLSLAREGYQQAGQSSHKLRVLALMILPAWFLASSILPGLLTEIETGIETSFAHTDQEKMDVNLLDAASMFTAYQVVNSFHQRIYQLAERNNKLFELLTDPRKVAAIQVSNMAYHYARANIQTQRVQESITELRHALRMAHQYSLPYAIMFGYWSLTAILIFVGHLEEAKKLVEEIIEYEQTSGVHRVTDLIGWMHFFSGEQWEKGIKALRSSIQNMQQASILTPVATNGMVLAHLLLARNEQDEAQYHLHAAQQILEQINGHRYLFWLEWGFAKLSTVQKNLSQAEKWYEHVLKRWKMTEEMLFMIPILKDGAAFYAETGNFAQASVWLTELQAVVARTENPVGVAALLEAQGIIAVRRRKFSPAIETLRQAVDAWGALKFRYYQALVAQHLAEALLQHVDRQTSTSKVRQQAREEAESLLQQADLVYEQLGIAGQREAVQQLRTRTRLDAQRKRRRTMAMQRRAEDLTPREIHILRLLAAGKTNKEIAATLGISIGTVEQHVNHILTKLNCENRTQAVLHAVSKGWITPPS